jgi:hypothetical protein
VAVNEMPDKIELEECMESIGLLSYTSWATDQLTKEFRIESGLGREQKSDLMPEIRTKIIGAEMIKEKGAVNSQNSHNERSSRA